MPDYVPYFPESLILQSEAKRYSYGTLSCFLSGNSARKEIILEPSYEIADARVRAVGGMSSEHLSAFVKWLSSQQYSAGYACIVARHALAFGRWCKARGIEFSALTDVEIERYQRSRARRRPRRPETRRQERQALKLLLLFLREQKVCAAATSCITAVDRLCAEFAQHLRCNHALAESFFASLEGELIERSTFQSKAQARLAVFTWIEGWYNPRRRHSGLGYLSPLNFERSNEALFDVVDDAVVHDETTLATV